MKRRVSAVSLRLAAASLLLAMGSFQVLADTADSPATSSTGTGASTPNPAAAFTRMFGGSPASDGNGTSTPPHRHHRSHHTPAPDSTSGSSAAASWLPQSAAPATASASAAEATESARETSSAPIAGTFSKAPAESRVSDWLPSNDTAASESGGISTSARIDLIAEKYGKQATVDFNSRIQEPNGVIAFRAIDNQTGERETIRIDRGGDIKLKSGWPE